MLPATWKPVATGGLIIVGSPGDGSYILSQPSLADVTLLISMGLNDDWSFEAGFRQRTGARILCFDHSVDGRFWLKYAIAHGRRGRIARAFRYFRYRAFFSQDDVAHRRLMIRYDRPGECSLDTIIADVEDKAIYLKIDIEGGEYRILDQIVAHRDRITGISMELHDVDLHRERISRFFDEMTGFSLIGLHPNNVGGTDPAGDPVIVEIAMVADRFLRPAAGETAPVLQPNDPNRPEIAIAYDGAI